MNNIARIPSSAKKSWSVQKCGALNVTSTHDIFSWSLYHSTGLVMARTGLRRCGPQQASASTCSSSSSRWSCFGRLPQRRGQTAYSSSSSADDGIGGPDTIFLHPALGRIFSPPRPASPPAPAGPAYPQSKPGLASGLQIPVPPASSSSASAPLPAPSQSDVASLPAATSTLTAPPDVQAMIKDWQDAFFKTMQDRMQILMGDAPPQPTASSSIPQRNMDPNELWQLSPSGDREASWAQHKSGTKRADGCSRPRSPAGDRYEASRDSGSRVREFSASSSLLSKWLRADSRSPVRRSCSQDDRWRSPGPLRHRASPQPYVSHRSCSSASHSQRRRSRDRSSLISPPRAGMTRRLARNVSLSPRCRSPSHPALRSSRGRRTSPHTRRMSPNHRRHYSSSRSPTPTPLRRQSSHSRSPRSRSSSTTSARGGPTSSQATWRFSCVSTRWRPGCWPEFISWWFPIIGGGSQETFWWLTLSSSSFPLCWPLSSYGSDKHSAGILQ